MDKPSTTLSGIKSIWKNKFNFQYKLFVSVYPLRLYFYKFNFSLFTIIIRKWSFNLVLRTEIPTEIQCEMKSNFREKTEGTEENMITSYTDLHYIQVLYFSTHFLFKFIRLTYRHIRMVEQRKGRNQLVADGSKCEEG